jgi:anti-anti-sigma factor
VTDNSEDPAFETSVSDYGSCTAITAAGALDRISAPVLAAQVDEVWDWNEGPRLVLDVGRVTFCDFAGVGVFARIAQRLLKAKDARVVLVGLGGRLLRLLRRTRLIDSFIRRDTVEEAVAALTGVRVVAASPT